MFHDADAWRLCASPLRIGESHAWPSLAGCASASSRIPTLESLLTLVGGRVPLLLEVKVGRRHLALDAGAEARRWTAMRARSA